jgi:hypothetical protein
MGIRSTREIHRYTKIPFSTISYQLKKRKTQAFLEHRTATGQKIMINAKCSRKLTQFIRRNNEVTLKELVEK